MLDKEKQQALIAQGRALTKGYQADDPYAEMFESDQSRRLPQPPLVKPAMAPGDARTSLPRTFDGLLVKPDLTDILRDRRSVRIYTQEEVSLEQLSYLLWATQGVKGMRGKSYATLRTVPCGGARHEFETYLVVRKITGLQPGLYHYLPMEHAVEFLGQPEDLEAEITQVVCGQSWAAKANALFLWTMVPYRAEWRYGIYAHRPALMDMGHVGENLYLACTGLGLGTCGIAAISHEDGCRLLGLDGEEEYPVYAMPVGTAREADQAAEQAFYQFVIDEGL